MPFPQLKKTRAKLRKWSKKLFSKAKLALQVILRLDIAQQNRSLSKEERDLRTRLKRRVVWLAVVERAKKNHNPKRRGCKDEILSHAHQWS
jgi:hypothetical protein